MTHPRVYVNAEKALRAAHPDDWTQLLNLERAARDLPNIEDMPNPTKQAECGSTGGYQRHLRLGEETCGPCRAAWGRYGSEYRKARRAGLTAEPKAGRQQAKRDAQSAAKKALRKMYPDEYRALLMEAKVADGPT